MTIQAFLSTELANQDNILSAKPLVDIRRARNEGRSSCGGTADDKDRNIVILGQSVAQMLRRKDPRDTWSERQQQEIGTVS